MSDVTVRAAAVELRTVKPTKALLRQVRRLGYSEVRHLLDGGEFKEGAVLGWIHGSVLGDEHMKYLLLAVGEGDIGLVEAGISSWKAYRQLYIA